MAAKREGASQEEVTGLTTNAIKEIEKEEVAWKKLSGDVMRVPKYPMIMSFFVGTGMHVFVLTYVFLLSMTVGFFSIFLRLTWVCSFFMIMAGAGWFNGFTTAQCMKTAGLTDWIGGATVSAFVYPSIVLICFAFVDIIEWYEDPKRYPLTSPFLYGVIWMTVSIAATYHGATTGYRMSGMSSRTKVSAVKKRIPAQPFYLNMCILMPVFGAIQFASIFVEFMYIWNSIWRSQIYAMFGSLFINMLILICVISCLSIIQTYFQLRHENHEWHWRAFLTGASCGIYIGLYTFYYMAFIAKMNMWQGELIYFVWAVLFTYSISVMCGMIALLASAQFVESIYSNIKSD